jgi:hypothetical protein
VRLHLLGGQESGIELIVLGVCHPCLVTGEHALVLESVECTTRAKADLRLDQRLHGLPEFHALDDERKLSWVAPGLAAPAPVAARLLGADRTFLAECYRHALLRQEERRARPDDAAADDHHVAARRQGLVRG